MLTHATLRTQADERRNFIQLALLFLQYPCLSQTQQTAIRELNKLALALDFTVRGIRDQLRSESIPDVARLTKYAHAAITASSRLAVLTRLMEEDGRRSQQHMGCGACSSTAGTVRR